MNEDDTSHQNRMLEAFKAENPQFGPKPPPPGPVFHTDAVRLEECRRALQKIMDISFLYDEKPLPEINALANVALARTQGELRCQK